MAQEANKMDVALPLLSDVADSFNEEMCCVLLWNDFCNSSYLLFCQKEI